MRHRGKDKRVLQKVSGVKFEDADDQGSMLLSCLLSQPHAAVCCSNSNATTLSHPGRKGLVKSPNTPRLHRLGRRSTSISGHEVRRRAREAYISSTTKISFLYRRVCVQGTADGHSLAVLQQLSLGYNVQRSHDLLHPIKLSSVL